MRFTGALGTEDRNGDSRGASHEVRPGVHDRYVKQSRQRTDALHGRLDEPPAGVREEPSRRHDATTPREELPNARREELLEAFSGYCQHVLINDDRFHAVDHLKNAWGFSRRGAEALGLGVYPAQEAVIEELQRLGFHREEIADATVAGDRRLEGRIIVPWRDRRGRLCTIAAISDDPADQASERTLFLRGGAKHDPYCTDRAAAGPLDHLVIAEGVLETAFLQSIGLENVVAFGSVGKLVSARLWEHLSALGVRRVTLAFSDDDKGRARAMIAIREAASAENAPEVFSVSVGAFGTATTPAAYTRRHGLEALISLFEQQHHGFAYAAAALAARRSGDAYVYQDSAVLSVLEDALDFEAVIDDAPRTELLDRYFWPTLHRAIGASWEELRRRYGPRFEPFEARRRQIAEMRKRRLLVRDLRDALRREDLRLVDALILSAADEIRGDEGKPRSAASPKLDRDDWVMEPDFGRAPNEDEVRLAAYYMWQAAGRPAGKRDQYWNRAEQWLRGDLTRDEDPARDAAAALDV